MRESCVSPACVCVCISCACRWYISPSIYLSIYISVYLSVHCDGRLLCALCHALFLYFPRSSTLFFPNSSSLSLFSLHSFCPSTFAFVFHISLFFAVTRTVHCLPHCLIGRGRQMTYPHTHRHTHAHTHPGTHPHALPLPRLIPMPLI